MSILNDLGWFFKSVKEKSNWLEFEELQEDNLLSLHVSEKTWKADSFILLTSNRSTSNM